MIKSKYASLKYFIPYDQIKRPVNWSEIFDNDNPIDVEIGFGNGDYLTRIAKLNPERNFIGLEQFWERVCKTLRKGTHSDVHNVRLLLVDARLAFERLILPSSIANIYCLFPCPWPKKGHVKHRLFSNSFLKLLNSRLKSAGQLKIITDFLPFKNWILEQVEGTGFRVKTSLTEPQFDTKYERKWLLEGQEKFYELQMFKSKHIDIPLKEDVALKTYMVDDFNPAYFKMNDQRGDISIIFKEYLYDEKNKKAMVRLIVSEENIMQHLWVAIVFVKEKWCVCPLEGQRFIPTPGIAQALKLVFEACQKNKSLVK